MACVHSLADLAAAAVCDTLDTFVESFPGAILPDQSVLDIEHRDITLAFKEDLFLPSAISEKLIYMLSEFRLLNDATLSLFNSKNTQLQ